MHTATNPAGDDLIVLTRAEYDTLTNEDAADAAAFDEAKRTASGLTISAADMAAILSGDLHPLTAWRKAAGMTQAQLSKASGVRAATISDIEGAHTDPRLGTMKALAGTLGVDLDDIAQ